MSVTPSQPGRTPNNYPYLNTAPAPAPTTITDTSSDGVTDARQAGNFNTAPTGYGQPVDEFGTRLRSTSIDKPAGSGIDAPQVQTIGAMQAISGAGNSFARPRSSGRAAPAGNRLTVTNFAVEDMPEEVRNQNIAKLAAQARHQRTGSTGSRTGSRAGWMNAEDEKRMLYEHAKAQVEQVQGGPRKTSPPLSPRLSPPLEVCVAQIAKSLLG